MILKKYLIQILKNNIVFLYTHQVLFFFHGDFVRKSSLGTLKHIMSKYVQLKCTRSLVSCYFQSLSKSFCVLKWVFQLLKFVLREFVSRRRVFNRY